MDKLSISFDMCFTSNRLIIKTIKKRTSLVNISLSHCISFYMISFVSLYEERVLEASLSLLEAGLLCLFGV